MRILCDNCGAKYSIADEKVQSKVFKIRCKKCSHVIVVKGEHGESTGSAAVAGESPVVGTPVEDEAVWHAVINQQQEGPMTASEVRRRFAKGEINIESYLWKEGLSDWIRLKSITEFADVANPDQNQSAGEKGVSAGAPNESTQIQPAPLFSSGEGSSPNLQEREASGVSSAKEAASTNALFAVAPSKQHAIKATSVADESSGDLFGSASTGESSLFDERNDASDQSNNDLFAAAEAAGKIKKEPDAVRGGGVASSAMAGGGGLSATESRASDAGSVKLTGQRNENSVLFSLSNLQSMTVAPNKSGMSPGISSSPSGLIDLSGTSSASKHKSDADDLPPLLSSNFSASVGPSAMMLPLESDKPPWFWPLIIGSGVLALGIVVLLVVLLTRSDDRPVAEAPTAPATSGAIASNNGQNANTGVAAKTAASTVKERAHGETPRGSEGSTAQAGSAGTETASKDQPSAGTEQGSTEAADEKSKETPATKRRVAAPRRSSSDDQPSRQAATEAPKATEPLAATTPKKSTGAARPKDELDDLLDSAVGGGKGTKRPKSDGEGSARQEAPAANLPESLTKAELQRGMTGIKGSVQSCYDRFRVPGMIEVNVTIGRNGRVSESRAKGKFAGTPTGDCVAKAVSSASFPRFSGNPITFSYPFILK